MEYDEIISKLGKLDLSFRPHDEVLGLLKSFGRFGLVTTTLGAGKRIIRARVNNSYWQKFESVSELSYPPSPNGKFGRANSPGKVMFYGSIVPEMLGESEPSTARATVLYEVSDFSKDINSTGIEKITFSSWEVERDINLVSLIHFENFDRPTKLSEKANSDFKRLISSYPELKEKSIGITKYLSSEFAKNNITEDYQYLISSVFTEMVCAEGWDGVLYPSVPLAGNGINISIKPEVVDTNLKFNGALECNLLKKEKKALIDNRREAQIHDANRLKYVRLPKERGLGLMRGCRHVGMSLPEILIAMLKFYTA